MSRTFGDKVGHYCGITDVPGKFFFLIKKIQEVIIQKKDSSHKA